MISHKIYDLKLLRPLVSMGSTFAMCIILSACQASKAATDYSDAQITTNHSRAIQHNSEHHSEKHRISIIGNDEDRFYVVDGKRFSNSQLSEKQKSQLAALNEKLSRLETSLEFDEARMEAWSEKMESMVEQIEIEAEKIEAVFEGFEFDDFEINLDDAKSNNFDHIRKNMSAFSKEMELASQSLAAKMKHLETNIEKIEIDIPRIDDNIIKQIEIEAKKMETLLVEIAQDI